MLSCLPIEVGPRMTTCDSQRAPIWLRQPTYSALEATHRAWHIAPRSVLVGECKKKAQSGLRFELEGTSAGTHWATYSISPLGGGGPAGFARLPRDVLEYASGSIDLLGQALHMWDQMFFWKSDHNDQDVMR